jgi:uncharacterized protein
MSVAPAVQPSGVLRRLFRFLLKMWGVTVIVVLLGWVGLMLFITNHFLHPAPIRVGTPPNELRNVLETVSFPSAADNLPLKGWFLPASGTPKGVVILCHGRDDNRAGMLPHARYLSDAGFSCLLFDFRCCGDSDGDTTTIGWKETDDVIGAVQYLKSRADTKDLPIGAFGVSMGGASVLQAAAKCPDIKVVGADCSYAVLPSAIDQRFRAFLGPAHPVFSGPIRFWGERALNMNADTVSPEKAATQFGNRPLLLIHGTWDITILPEDSERIYAAATGPKELWLVPKAFHAHAFSVDPAGYEQRVRAHFAKLATKL